ncbi:hypothetical protein [Coraliomargarita sinensis]|uniref:hypothetical protein n=1 Tax=Coraliomargarita sinensis TaxID=2174842 RepID=UPI0018EE7522|nr:hypothetical protein [Coraliomargarita sinensis]
MKIRLKIVLSVLVILTFCSVLYHIIPFKPDGELSDFKSDGCSLFPDSSLINADDWCDCCLAHDIAYWKGGTEAERLAADEALRDCVLETTGNAELAEAMYLGVRMGGSPYFKNWYRWGYGWNYTRKYQPLTEREKKLAASKLKAFFANDPVLPCD